MKKLLIIKDRNKVILIKNIKVRTPCNLEIADEEIDKMILFLKMNGIVDYNISPVCVVNKEKCAVSKQENIKIEELTKEYDIDSTKTILERLMNGEY